MPDRDEALAALRGLSEHDLKLVVGELTLDPRVRRREGFRGWWYRYAGSVAFVALVILGAAGFFYVQHFNVQLRDGLVANCENNANPLREYLAGEAQRQIQQQQGFDQEQFFPNVPPDLLHKLIQDQIDRERHALDTILAPVNCETLYPR